MFIYARMDSRHKDFANLRGAMRKLRRYLWQLGKLPINDILQIQADNSVCSMQTKKLAFGTHVVVFVGSDVKTVTVKV